MPTEKIVSYRFTCAVREAVGVYKDRKRYYNGATGRGCDDQYVLLCEDCAYDKIRVPFK